MKTGDAMPMKLIFLSGILTGIISSLVLVNFMLFRPLLIIQELWCKKK